MYERRISIRHIGQPPNGEGCVEYQLSLDVGLSVKSILRCLESLGISAQEAECHTGRSILVVQLGPRNDDEVRTIVDKIREALK